MRIFDRKYETLPREELDQLQLERAQALLARIRRNVRRYREQIGDIRLDSLADLARMPVIAPEDLAAAFPYGMFALPLREVIRLHSAVGPEGQQLVIGHTRNDLTHWGRLVARQLAAAGVTANDVIQICFEPGILKGATGYTLGAEMLEASVIPEDPFHIEYQLTMLQNYRVSVLITTPSNARELADLLAAGHADPQSLSLRTVLLSRPVSGQERQELKTGLFADIRCNFGVAEILDPGFCVQCDAGHYHANEDQFIVETLNGELLVTTLCREAMPLLRYATRIACALRRDKCPCGRTGVIIEPGERTDGRLRVNEMPIYPRQISEVLARTRAAGQPFQVDISERRIGIALTVTPGLFSDTMRALIDLKKEIETEFQERLGIEAEVSFHEPPRPAQPQTRIHPGREPSS